LTGVATTVAFRQQIPKNAFAAFPALRQPQRRITMPAWVEWGNKMDKPWEDMTTNEKLNLLKAQIQELRSAYNIATCKIAKLQVEAEGLRKRDTA
jgi:hypothetical protein